MEGIMQSRARGMAPTPTHYTLALRLEFTLLLFGTFHEHGLCETKKKIGFCVWKLGIAFGTLSFGKRLKKACGPNKERPKVR